MNLQSTENRLQFRKWLTTVILAVFLGSLGVDRFYNRQIGWGIWKLLTLGGFGIWWLSDIILWSAHKNDFVNFINDRKNISKYSLSIGLICIISIVILYFSLQFSIKSYKVFDISELPTLQPGDQIIVSKLAYKFSNPKRGEHIVFYSARHNKDLIKRIIAIPGDKVEVKGGTVFVNDIPLDEPYIYEAPRYILFAHTVPTDNYFVLGDDRNNSDDSHNGWTVPREAIVGKVIIIYCPPTRFSLYQPYSSYKTP